jgi:hypothetical protein
MTMSEDEFEEKARKEYRKMSRREQDRVTESEESFREWLKGIWTGVKSWFASVFKSLTGDLF